jgi:hypothetical protein
MKMILNRFTLCNVITDIAQKVSIAAALADIIGRTVTSLRIIELYTKQLASEDDLLTDLQNSHMEADGAR